MKDALRENTEAPCDCLQHLDEAKHVARATWVCKNCGEDVSLEYFLYQEMLRSEPRA